MTKDLEKTERFVEEGTDMVANAAHEAAIRAKGKKGLRREFGRGPGEENPLQNTLGEAAGPSKNQLERSSSQGTPVENTLGEATNSLNSELGRNSGEASKFKRNSDEGAPVKDALGEAANPLKRKFGRDLALGRGPGEGTSSKKSVHRRPGKEVLEQKSRSASAKAGPRSSTSSQSGAGAGHARIEQPEVGPANPLMKKFERDPALGRGPGEGTPSKKSVHRRPGKEVVKLKSRSASAKAAPSSSSSSQSGAGAGHARIEKHMNRSDPGPSRHRGESSHGASSTALIPAGRARDAQLPSELSSPDPRVRVEFLLQEFDNLRRRFHSEKERKRRQFGGAPTTNPDMQAYNKIKSLKWLDNTRNNERIEGHVPGVDVGDHYRYRMEMLMISLHRDAVKGIDYIRASESKHKGKHKDIHGNVPRVSVAVSVVSSGEYDDDKGDTIIYTGHGGNLNMRSRQESKDQKDPELKDGNLALKNLCDLKLAVRVVRKLDVQKYDVKKKGSENTINFQSPSGSVYVYAGLYDVVRCDWESGVRGRKVWKYTLSRQPGQPRLSDRVVMYKDAGLPPQLEARGERVLYGDIARGCEPVKIRVVRHKDCKLRPRNFTYIRSMQLHPSVRHPASLGCKCQGSVCAGDASCSCDRLNHGPAYNEDGSLLWAKRLVYECGRCCSCSDLCTNKVVQKGLRYDMEVFRTERKGWGVRSRTFIPQGSFVCEIVGEVIHSKEAEQRVQQDKYLFDLKIPDNMEGRFGRWSRLISLPESESGDMEGKADEPEAAEFTIDCRNIGNVGRFINHSCAPNLFVQCVLSDHHDLRFPHIALFAQEHITPYKELSYDYGYVLDTVTEDGHIKQKRCYCLAGNCRGRLY